VIPKTGSAQNRLPRLLIAASGMTSLPYADGLKAGAVPRLARHGLLQRIASFGLELIDLSVVPPADVRDETPG
jgi:hypothetical protein